MRKAPALIVTAGLIGLTLTGCSPAGQDDCTSSVSSGSASEIVTVEGTFGAPPIVDFPLPVKAEQTERTVNIEGDGAAAGVGQVVMVDMTVLNGTTGEVVQETGYNGMLSPFSLTDSTIPGLLNGLQCVTAGSRVTIAVPPIDAFGPAGGNPSLGVAENDTLIFVMDVANVSLPRADGAAQPAQPGFPAVVLNEDGVPGITVPGGDAPTELQVATLKKGTGPVIVEGDPVIAHYTGVVWETRKEFSSSWTTGSPATLVAASGANVSGGVIPGLADALIGQTVGSQIIAVIPPELGYGSTASGSIPADSTLIFVVDILGIG